MKKAIIVGASSGIGKELAKALAAREFIVGLAARRLELLSELAIELPTESYTKRIDISRPDEAKRLLTELIEEMKGTDLIILCSAICIYNPELHWDDELTTLNVNIIGITAMANVAYNYFCNRGAGHLVGISSFKALRGGGSSPAYNASKAFLSNYLEGLRINAAKQGNNVLITDIRPGLVDNSGKVRKFGIFRVPAPGISRQICKAIENRKSIAYVPKRYFFIAHVLKHSPFCLYRTL